MESYELVNIKGENTGKILTQTEAYDMNNIHEGYYMPVVGVVIINSKNEILFQKRSKCKKNNPGKWGICGGKVNFGETPIEAGVRETFEEIGISLNKEDLKFVSINPHNKGFFTVYYVKQDVDINNCKLQKEEVEELKYFKIEELRNLNSEGVEWLDSLEKIMKTI